MGDFLSSSMARPWVSARTGLDCEYFVGESDIALEVIVVAEQDSQRH